MQKIDMPFIQVIEDYISDLRIQRRSPKTLNFYLRNLQLFLKWLKRHNYKGVLGDLTLTIAKRYILYLGGRGLSYPLKCRGHPLISYIGVYIAAYGDYHIGPHGMRPVELK